jgi:CrcB protein
VITGAAFVLAAALGAVARAAVGHQWNRHDGLALGTLAVNVAGSFLLGLLWDTAPPEVTVVGVGGLGAFTTFSSFARDVVALAEIRRAALAGAYLMLTLTAGVAAAALAVALVA